MMKVFFQMNESQKKHLIDGHNFYIEQSQSRLLSQFNKIETEAEKFGEDWLQESNQYFNPERHDPADFYEQAYDESVCHYQMLEDIRSRTRFSVVAGFFHEWDKQLRSWLTREIHHWRRGDIVKNAVWQANFPKIMGLLESFGWPIRAQAYYSSIDRCKLVVNAYKHGAGQALESIKSDHPEFLNVSGPNQSFHLELAGHSNLKIEESHITEFSDAIVEFWNNVPESVFRENIDGFPKWFGDAYKKDLEQLLKEGKK